MTEHLNLMFKVYSILTGYSYAVAVARDSSYDKTNHLGKVRRDALRLVL